MSILTESDLDFLRQRACAVRRDILSMITTARSGHPGGSLSAVEIVTLLYAREMRVDPADPDKADRDRFVLSKGHAAPVLYAVLAHSGFFPRGELCTLRQVGARLQGHPDMKHIPGVDMSTGSLGQGLSAAAGMALAARLDGRDTRVFALLGDGELEEGQVWEAAMFAAHYRLSNLTAIVDFNGLQIDGPVAEVLSPLPIPEKWRAFGWNVLEADGHDFQALHAAVRAARDTADKPSVIVARTCKGKGVGCMENVADWHGKAPTHAECEQFLCELPVQGG
jgi:transketolase